MFELIRSHEKEDAIEIIHYIVSVLTKSKNEPDYEIEIENSNRILQNKDMMEVCNAILEELDYESLKDEELDTYIIELYNLLQELLTSNVSFDLDRGRELLKSLNENEKS
ncbi:hypothetical protein [Lysinibacillus sp. GbtcB16]|uniref:hypothetical protein n=1 Tax=Lysinibacillus sp. GbtcB16 TaxID=2824761 RepID=UPI001C303A41|nr:hypothetical protein [Lysinibacillus sp. GbtcB16]